MVLVFLVAFLGCQSQVEETGLFHGTHIDGGMAVLEGNLT